MSEPWKLEILRRMRDRNIRETSCFQELILSHGRLLEQVQKQKKNIRSLEYKKDEVDQELLDLQKEGTVSGTGGGQVSKLSKRIEELQSRLMTKTDDLSEAHRSKSEIMIKMAEQSAQLHKKDDELSKSESHVNLLNATIKKLEEKVHALQEAMKASEQAGSKMMDEHTELQVEFNAQEKKIKELKSENIRIRQEVLKMKTEEAERMNQSTEKEKEERQKMIKEQIEQAAKPKTPLPLPVERRGSKKGASGGIRTPDYVDPTAIYPSVLPEKVFYHTEGHDGEISALCFSSDGQYLATGGTDKVVKIWTVRSTQEKLESSIQLPGSGASIMSVQFDHLNKYILAASNDFAARIWTVGDQRPRHTLTGHSAKVFTAKFMDDSQKVITGSQDKTLKIWDLKQRKCIKTLFAGSSCCDLVPAQILGNMIISGHWDRKIRFWDLRVSGVNELAIQGRVTSLSLFPDRYMLLCSTRDDTSLRLIDLRQNAITSTFTGFNLSTDWSRACFSPDGQYVAVGASDGTIHMWEAMTGRAHKTKRDSSVHRGDIVACSWHPKGQIFASVDRNKKIALWKQ